MSPPMTWTCSIPGGFSLWPAVFSGWRAASVDASTQRAAKHIFILKKKVCLNVVHLPQALTAYLAAYSLTYQLFGAFQLRL